MGILSRKHPRSTLKITAFIFSALVSLAFLSGCTQDDDDSLELGETAELVTDSGEKTASITILSAEFASTCPSRVDPETELAGNFLLLSVEVSLASDPDPGVGVMVTEDGAFMPTSPEQFYVVNAEGATIGGTNMATTWECYSDSDLLPAITLEGETHQGYVVLEVIDTPAYITFGFDDESTWQWKL